MQYYRIAKQGEEKDDRKIEQKMSESSFDFSFSASFFRDSGIITVDFLAIVFRLFLLH